MVRGYEAIGNAFSRRRLVAYAATRGFLWIEPGDGEDTVGP